MADAPFASPPAQLSAGHPVLGTDPTTHGSTPLMTGYNTPAQLQSVTDTRHRAAFYVIVSLPAVPS